MNERAMIVQLSHLVADGFDVQGDESILIDIFAENNGKILYANLSTEVRRLFQITMSEARINAALRRMNSDGRIIQNRNHYIASEKLMAEITQNKQHNETIENTALNEWVIAYENKNPELVDDEKDQLKTKIAVFIKTVFIKHGVESLDILTGESKNAALNIKQIAAEITEDVSSPFKDRCYIFLINIFSDPKTQNQNEYIMRLFNKAVRYVSLVMDKPIIKAILNRFNGLTVYLDTSVMYRLMNLQGESRYKSIKEIVEICKVNGVILRFFQHSVAELARRLNFEASIIDKYPTPINLAYIGYKMRTSDNYISTYWKARMETGVSTRDFNARYSNIRAILKSLEIEVDETDYNGIQQVCEDRDKLRPKVVNFDTDKEDERKSYNAIEHDAFTLAIINYLQKKDVDTIVDSRYILLTVDRSLIALQNLDHDYKNKQKMAVLPSHLLQIMCFTQPEKDYYGAFMGLFSSSSSMFGSSALTNAQISDILNRIGFYDGVTQKLAEDILSNELIQKAFSKPADDEDLDDLIHEALIEAAQDTESKLEETISAFDRLKSQQEELYSEISRSKSAMANQAEEYEKKFREMEERINILMGQKEETHKLVELLRDEKAASDANARTISQASRQRISELEHERAIKEKENDEIKQRIISNANAAGKFWRKAFRLISIIIFVAGFILVGISVISCFPHEQEEVVAAFASNQEGGKQIAASNNDTLLGILKDIGLFLITPGFAGFFAAPKVEKWRIKRYKAKFGVHE